MDRKPPNERPHRCHQGTLQAVMTPTWLVGTPSISLLSHDFRFPKFTSRSHEFLKRRFAFVNVHDLNTFRTAQYLIPKMYIYEVQLYILSMYFKIREQLLLLFCLFKSIISKFFHHDILTIQVLYVQRYSLLSNLNSRGIIFDSIGSTVSNLQYPTVVSSYLNNYNCLDLLYLVKLSTEKKLLRLMRNTGIYFYYWIKHKYLFDLD